MPHHRLSIARTFVLVLCAANVPGAAAQAEPRDPQAASRVERDASNPMRMIIEASKLKQRAKPESDPAKAPSAEKRAPRAAKPAVAAPVAKAAQPAPSASVATAAAAPAPASSVPPAPVLVKSAEAVPTALSTPKPILPSPKPVVLPPLPLKLAQLVEPSLPNAVVRRMNRDMEVVVAFTVNAYGTVSDVAIRSSPMKAMDASVVEAVSQWRYEPIREARAHAVQLVLRANR